MADAKASRPGKDDEDATKPVAKDGEKLVKKEGREFVEKSIGGKKARTFVDVRKA